MFQLPRRLVLVSALALGLPPLSHAADSVATRDEAVALVKKAIAFADTNGLEKLYAEVNAQSPQFSDRNLYVYVTRAGTVMAHGANMKLIGRDLTTLKDADGRAFVDDIVKLGDSGQTGWVEYRWPNPITKKVEDKVTYVEKYKDVIFCAGVYK